MLSLTSELEAVNAMLRTVRQAPVSTLIGDIGLDAEFARDMLRERSLAVQSERWSFNYVPSVELTPHLTTKEIQLPNGAVSADVPLSEQRTDIDVTVRGTRLFDRCDNSYEFDKPVKVELLMALDWEDLPQQARHFIYVSAARRFQDRVLGSGEDHQFQLRDEFTSRQTLMEWDAQQADHSMFDSLVTLRPLNRPR